jgi:hypothetical protein
MLEEFLANWESLGYSTSLFLSSRQSSRDWFANSVINPNPRLSSDEKSALLNFSDNCYSAAGDWVPFNSATEASAYWSCMAAGIGEYTADSEIIAIVLLAADNSNEIANPEIITEREPDKSTIPLIGLAVLFLVFWMKK